MNRRTRRMSAPGSRRDYEMCKVGTTSPAPRCLRARRPQEQPVTEQGATRIGKRAIPGGRVELCSASVIVYWKLLKFGDGLVRRREFIRVVGELWAALPLHCRSRRAQRTRSCRWWGSSMAHHRPDTVSSYRHFATGWRSGLCRGPKCHDRVPLGKRPIRSTAGLVADLVSRRVSVIAATSTPVNVVAKRGTETIPIVFTTSSDPVELGLVASLGRPGGNVTGIVMLNVLLPLQ